MATAQYSRRVEIEFVDDNETEQAALEPELAMEEITLKFIQSERRP